jgi:hypothetical protein
MAPTKQDAKPFESKTLARTKETLDELDTLLQEYRDFFQSEGEKYEYVLLNISLRLEQNFLSESALRGSEKLKREASIKLKNFLENDPELKITERRAIAKSLNIALLENGQVERKPDFVKNSSPKSEVADQNLSAPEIDGLALIRSIVEDQKRAAKKKALQPVKNIAAGNDPKKAVRFSEIERDKCIGEIDKRLKEKYSKADAPNPKTKTTEMARLLHGRDTPQRLVSN